MVNTYKVNGMTCSGCQRTIQKLLSSIEGVKAVSIDLEKGETVIDMDNAVSTAQLKAALKNFPNYLLEEM